MSQEQLDKAVALILRHGLEQALASVDRVLERIPPEDRDDWFCVVVARLDAQLLGSAILERRVEDRQRLLQRIAESLAGDQAGAVQAVPQQRPQPSPGDLACDWDLNNEGCTNIAETVRFHRSGRTYYVCHQHENQGDVMNVWQPEE